MSRKATYRSPDDKPKLVEEVDLDGLPRSSFELIEEFDPDGMPQSTAKSNDNIQTEQITYCLPCEGIGSIPRPTFIREAFLNHKINGRGLATTDNLSEHTTVNQLNLQHEIDEVLADTMLRLSDICPNLPISDGEQTKASFITYPIVNMENLDPNGVVITFEDGHTRQLPKITCGPFEYKNYAVDYLKKAKSLAKPGTRIKQAVIAASAISLLYPSEPIPGYSREEFIRDLVQCAVKDIRQCLDEGADSVQVDFTEARLALKMDPSGKLLNDMLDINDQVFVHFNKKDRKRIGIHACAGADNDSCHSSDVEYDLLLPRLLELTCGRFYLSMKGEKDQEHVFTLLRDNIKPGQLIFIGAIDVNSPRVETPEEVASFILQAAHFLPINQLGVCDDCGFSPFSDDVSTDRDTAFRKIKARVDGARLASSKLFVRSSPRANTTTGSVNNSIRVSSKNPSLDPIKEEGGKESGKDT